MVVGGPDRICSLRIKSMRRREFLGALCVMGGGVCATSVTLTAQRGRTVSTLLGTGSPGYSDAQVSNPYGLAIGPDKRLYSCALDNERIRALDLATKKLTTIAGDGRRAYAGDGGPATSAALNMPHELRFDANGDIYVAER